MGFHLFTLSVNLETYFCVPRDLANQSDRHSAMRERERGREYTRMMQVLVAFILAYGYKSNALIHPVVAFYCGTVISYLILFCKAIAETM